MPLIGEPRRGELHRRSGCFVELDRNSGGCDALQRICRRFGALPAVDFKNETNNRVGVIFFGFAN
jgi:hypothetical protein